LKLYDSLPGAQKADLQTEKQRFASDHDQGAGVHIRDMLAMLNESFEQRRYVYELPKSGAEKFQQTIFAMHVCRVVCNREVAAASTKVNP
jgi:hypothetical protein